MEWSFSNFNVYVSHPGSCENANSDWVGLEWWFTLGISNKLWGRTDQYCSLMKRFQVVRVKGKKFIYYKVRKPKTQTPLIGVVTDLASLLS